MSRPIMSLLVVGAILIAAAAIFILLTRCDGSVSTPAPTLAPAPTGTATATLTPTPAPTLTPAPTGTATATLAPTPAPTLTPALTGTATATLAPTPAPTLTPMLAPAQGFPVPDKEDLESPELGTALDDLVSRIESGAVTEEEAAREAPVSRGKSVAVTIHLSGNVDGVVRFLEDNNVTRRHVGEDYIEAFVPVRSLREISEMTGVLYVETIVPPQRFQGQPVQGNGPEAHGSAAWNEAGFTGKGIKIGIIDAGFEGISQLLGTELPETVRARCYGTETDDPGGLENCGWGDHGTLVAESIIDIAPEASLYLGAAWSKGDLADIVDWMISEGVSVINMSLGWTFDGPGDGTSTSTGSPLNTLTRAVNEGIVWINSAGNEADSAWFGAPGDSDGDGVLEFGDFGEQLNLYTDGSHVVQLRWDGSWGGQTVDLDLYVYDEGGRIVRRSLNPQKGGAGHNPYERVVPMTGENTILQVANRSDTLPRWMQIVVWDGDIGESSRNGSIGSPGESSNPGMLTVGAAHWERTETIEMYSSRGPAPDGRIKPDVVGAACGETALLGPGGAFCGTSQASPHVAGMAALVRQMFPDFTPQKVVEYLVENAQERGSPGLDNTWGAGFSTLPTPSTPTPTPTSTPVATPRATPTPTAVTTVTPTPTAVTTVTPTPTAVTTVTPTPTAVTTVTPTPTAVTMVTPTPTAVTTATPTPTAVTTVTPTPTPAPNRDRHALEALYRATDGDNWEENGNWLSDAPLDEWYGVSIDDAGRVTGIDLRGNKLTGELPEELGYLSDLEVFELWGNSIFGEIPSSLGDLSRLTVLDLGENVLEGEIPEPLGNLDRLEDLYLSGDFHDLTGCIPVGLSDVPNNDFNLLGLPFCGPVAQEGDSPDRSILEIFYHATDGPNWTNNTNWLSDRPVGEWYGVTTDDSGNVTGLVLDSNQLSGQLPSELGSLSNLTGLWLYGNQLTGEIPQELGSLSNLTRLVLGSNQLSGEIPAELGKLSNLTNLRLANNELTGEIPPELGSLSNLDRLYLNDNQLSGEIPPEVGSLSNLTELRLGSNQLTGEIPPELGNLTNLGGLILRHNDLSGSIPPELGSLSNLTYTALEDNDLSGSIPPELGSLSNLTHLFLNANELSGSVPPELGSLSNLTYLSLDQNQLTGPLPLSLSGLSELDNLWFTDNAGLCAPTDATFQAWLKSISNVRGPNCEDAPTTSTPTDSDILEIFYNATDGPNWTNNTNWLSDRPVGEWYGVTTDRDGRVTRLRFGNFVGASNNLTGTIPPELGSLSSLTWLQLLNNQLTGEIPAELGNLSNLTRLDLGGNQFSGSIPVDLGSLSNLTRLGLENNRLTGEIPTELGNLSNLTILALSENQLSGSIPVELGGLSNLTELNFAKNQLTGQIPPELVDLSNLTILALTGNQLSGQIPPELGDLSSLTELYLLRNELSGEIPAEFGRLSNLKFLNLQSNRLSGEIPAELGNLSNLTDLHLSANQLSGKVPPELSSLTNLTGLGLGENQLSGEIPPELGSLANLGTLWLNNNKLSGSIPLELGSLVNLEWLFLSHNQLTGSLPLSLTGLTKLSILYFGSNAGLCAPTDAAFQRWLQAISNRDDGTNCEDAPTTSTPTDRSILEIFYNATDGPNWTNNTNWLSDKPLDEWYGVDTDDSGNVTGLILNDNQLSGSIPPELGSLANLIGLLLDSNQLSGSIPAELGNLANLTTLALISNQLSGSIPAELGNLANLIGLLLDNNQLSGEIPPELGNLANLEWLRLRGNQLTGPLPLSLSGLTELSVLSFRNNAGLCAPTDAAFQQWLQAISDVRGPNCEDTTTTSTPTDRDNLETFYNATDGGNWGNNTNWLSDKPLDEWYGVDTDDSGNVTGLILNSNRLSGSIPPELGSLSNLTILVFDDNQLSGSIPPEFGSLSNLRIVELNDNQLSGQIPSELGNLANLGALWLGANQLSGEIPPELGSLSKLQSLRLDANQLSGSLPLSLTGLTELGDLYFGINAGLCAPTDAAFQRWLQAISNRDNGPNCTDTTTATSTALTIRTVTAPAAKTRPPQPTASRSNPNAAGRVDNTGGLIGILDSGSIVDSYVVGNVVAGGGNAGGLIGYRGAGVVTASYWDRQTSDQPAAPPGRARPPPSCRGPWATRASTPTGTWTSTVTATRTTRGNSARPASTRRCGRAAKQLHDTEESATQGE